MRYRYLDDLRRRISVFAIFSYGIGTPPPPPNVPLVVAHSSSTLFSTVS